MMGTSRLVGLAVCCSSGRPVPEQAVVVILRLLDSRRRVNPSQAPGKLVATAQDCNTLWGDARTVSPPRHQSPWACRQICDRDAWVSYSASPSPKRLDCTGAHVQSIPKKSASSKFRQLRPNVQGMPPQRSEQQLHGRKGDLNSCAGNTCRRGRTTARSWLMPTCCGRITDVQMPGECIPVRARSHLES